MKETNKVVKKKDPRSRIDLWFGKIRSNKLVMLLLFMVILFMLVQVGIRIGEFIFH